MMGKRRGQPVHGWLNIDKPEGITSAAVVARVRKLLNAAKAGHAGTLDPLATGVIPIALGEATKTMSFAMDGDKTYTFTAIWGAATDTDDREGKVIATSDVRPTRAAILAALPRFVGEIDQVPPVYSAIKVDGARAYDLARDGENVELKPRKISVYSFDLVGESASEIDHFRVHCGKGTYIRALIRDLAQALGTVAHIGALRRTACGPFAENTSISLDKWESLGHSPAALAHLRPVRTVLDDIPALALTDQEAHRLRHGQSLALFPVAQRNPQARLAQGIPVQAVLGETLVAIAEVGTGMLRPVRVMSYE
ncbi:MAG: tRNA pseudouridine(55) synthase TruB [Rhodospirillaceae bacterium]|nr:tRNA pseudouridine(55) synthase TruB [Rhodospirillaceae bacterium]